MTRPCLPIVRVVPAFTLLTILAPASAVPSCVGSETHIDEPDSLLILYFIDFMYNSK